MNTTPSKSLTGVGVFASIAASLCCIAPLLAVIAGVSGAASAFSWLEPLRPYLIGLAVAALGYAWYKSLRKTPAKVCSKDEACKVENKSFLSSRSFLGVITILAWALISFPYYGHIFFPDQSKLNIVAGRQDPTATVSFKINGMSCAACEKEVNSELFKVKGVTDANTFYDKGLSIVKYDSTKVSVDQLRAAVATTGYKVKSTISPPGSR